MRDCAFRGRSRSFWKPNSMCRNVWGRKRPGSPRFLLLICLFAMCASVRAMAERVSLDFIPMCSTERKTMAFEWDQSWFSRPPEEYNHELARICCFFSDASYSLDQDGNPSDLIACYRKLGADMNSIRYHYGLDYNSEAGNDQCAYILATVPLSDGTPLVILTVRGTPAGNNEWLSNLNIANSKEKSKSRKNKKEAAEKPNTLSYHEGFLNAEQIILRALLEYTGGIKTASGRIKLLITGHSRGAAVANIIGSHIVQQGLFNTRNCYIYTIACPNVTTMNEELAKNSRFSFIWNIINAEDIVPAIPFNRTGDWNYRKFGNIKVLANAWSAGRQHFYQELRPKMNRTYCYLTGKDYQPSGVGSFITVQLGKLLASVNPDVDKFYKGTFALHKYLAKIVPAMFPSEEEKAEKEAKGPSLSDRVVQKVDESNDGIITKILEIVNNLHQSESYLSFLMELDEAECFSDAPSVQIIIKGLPDAAVLDAAGNEITRLKEGQTKLFELHESSAACRLGLQMTAIGFPVDDDFQIILTDTALFPTPVSIMTERYSADGVLQKSEIETIYPNRLQVYSISAGRSQMGSWGLDAQPLEGTERKEARQKTGIWKKEKRRLALEADLDSDLNLGLGVSYGTKLLYGTALYRIPLQENFLGTWEIDGGIGHKTKLWNTVYLNSELLARGVFVPDSDLREESEEETGRNGVFSFVPALRLSLAWQPLRKAQVFAYSMGSLAIRNFNESAFESHRTTIHPIELNDNLGLVLTFGMGIRF